MQTFAEIQANVDRGARFCDLVAPGWTERIDLELFDFSNSINCIVGQLFEYVDLSYNQGIDFMYANGFSIKGDDWSFTGRVNSSQCCEACAYTPRYDLWDVTQEMWAYKVRGL